MKKAKKKWPSIKLMSSFYWNNQISKKNKQMSRDSNIHISLTSYGSRIKKVFWTIESIFAQSIEFSSITLWLSREDITEDELPLSLVRLQKRGLRVAFVDENILSYKKLYYSYCEQYEQKNFQALLVTADDDVMYSPDWLTLLVNKYHEQGGVVCCRGHRISLDESGKPESYKEWNKITDNDININTGILMTPTGVSGVLYPMNALKGLDQQKDNFMALCSRADDIWFKCLTLSNGIHSNRVSDEQNIDYPAVLTRTTKRRGLALYNIHQGGNDIQMKNTVDYFSLEFKN